MTLDKRCLSPGCRGHACFGFGSLLKGVIRWACNAHRHLLQPSLPEPSRAPRPEEKKQGVLL